MICQFGNQSITNSQINQHRQMSMMANFGQLVIFGQFVNLSIDNCKKIDHCKI